MSKEGRLAGVLILFFAFVFLPLSAHAEFNTYWKTSITLDAEKPEVSHDVSWGRSADMKRGRGIGLSAMKFADWDNSVLKGLDDKDRMGKGAGTPDFRYTMGLPFLSPELIAWTRRNANNEIVGYMGIAWTIGYYSKHYFNPVATGAWNTFWHWGTAYLIIPWIGVGTEYMTENVYFQVQTFFILPWVGVGFHF